MRHDRGAFYIDALLARSRPTRRCVLPDGGDQAEGDREARPGSNGWVASAERSVEGAVGPPTLDALCARLTQEPYTLLHVICHGQLDAASKDTALFLASGDANKPLDLVSGTAC